MPAPGGACSGYLVRSPATTLVVDLGAGTLANLQRHVDIAAVDAVVLSHEHPDHWLDLTAAAQRACATCSTSGGLPVYGTAGTARIAGELIDRAGAHAAVAHVVDGASR